MKKPVKKVREYLDYNECSDWINKKYNIDIRNYAGRKFTGLPDDPPYQDFWHSVLDKNDYIVKGSFFNLDIYDDYWDSDWEREIVKMFRDEFEEYIEGETIEFWVEW